MHMYIEENGVRGFTTYYIICYQANNQLKNQRGFHIDGHWCNVLIYYLMMASLLVNEPNPQILAISTILGE